LLFLEAEFREPELGGNRADEHNCLSGTIQASTSGARCPAGGAGGGLNGRPAVHSAAPSKRVRRGLGVLQEVG
jgi:hypothetical protein